MKRALSLLLALLLCFSLLPLSTLAETEGPAGTEDPAEAEEPAETEVSDVEEGPVAEEEALAPPIDNDGPMVEITTSNLAGLEMDGDVYLYDLLTDPNVTLDKSDAGFQTYLAKAGLKAEDFSVVTVNGKRWVRIRLENYYTRGDSYMCTGSGPETETLRLHLPLRVFTAHPVGEVHPFGDIYVERGWPLPAYYDGSAEKSYRTATLVNAFPDENGLLGDGDTTTPRLWKYDASDLTYQIGKASHQGTSIFPGHGDYINTDRKAPFVYGERENLHATLYVGSDDNALHSYDYEAYIHLPDKNEENDFSLYLTGPAKRDFSTTESTTTISYSADGVTYVTGDAVTDWAAIRYVKAHVDVLEPTEAAEFTLPLRTDADVSTVQRSAKVLGSWRFRLEPDGEFKTDQVMRPAEYIYLPASLLQGQKNLNYLGDKFSFADDLFLFTVTPLDGAPAPLETTVTATAYDADAGTGGKIDFYVPFTAPGTYKYSIREIIPEDGEKVPGVNYATAPATLTATVRQAANGTFTVSTSGGVINNSLETRSISVKKVWDDADNEDGSRPDSVTMKLLANGADTGRTLTLTEAEDWSGTFTDIPKYDGADQITYTVEEAPVAGYDDPVYAGNAAEGFTVTNKHEPVPEPVTHVITYQFNGGAYAGSTDDITESYPYGTEITIHDAPTREGHTFLYWKGSEYQPGDSYTVTEDHTFVAQWEEEPEPEPTPTPKPEKPGTTPTPKPVTPGKTPPPGGPVSTTTPRKAPTTGDPSDPALWLAVLALSLGGGAAAAGVLWKRMKTER